MGTLEIARTWTPSDWQYVRRRMPATFNRLWTEVCASEKIVREMRRRDACRCEGFVWRCRRAEVKTIRRRKVEGLPASFEEIVAAVTEVSGYTLSELKKTPNRKIEASHWRHVMFYMVFRHTRLSSVVIGRLGNRDRTTAVYSRDKVRREYSMFEDDIDRVLAVTGPLLICNPDP